MVGKFVLTLNKFQIKLSNQTTDKGSDLKLRNDENREGTIFFQDLLNCYRNISSRGTLSHPPPFQYFLVFIFSPFSGTSPDIILENTGDTITLLDMTDTITYS